MQHSDFLPASRPALVDLASCDRWLDRARFTDPHQACTAFIGLLDEIEDAPPQASVCVRILEKLRIPMQTALVEQSRRFAGKPLPLNPSENASYLCNLDLWLAQIRAWRRLLRASWNKLELASERARLALRTLEATAGLLSAQLMARHEITAGHWRWLHQGYAQAEKENLANIEVGSPYTANTTTCTAVYTQVLLLQLANTGALAQREFLWTSRWARRWASKVSLWRSAENGGGLAVDLDGQSGPQWTRAGTPGAALRFIDCSQVARSIRTRQQKIAEGATPESLGLGRDCPPVAAEELLNALLHCWSDKPQTRQFPRRATSGTTELVTSFSGIHQAIAGSAFVKQASPWDYTRLRVEQIQVFQRVVEERLATPGITITEPWESLDESANGFRLRRKTEGARIAHRQLAALRPGGASQFILCEIRWLSAEPDKSICIGAKALPGLPQACAIRPVKTNPLVDYTWTQAFALPLSKNLSPNLVLPIGWYQPDRELELKLGDEELHIRLDEIVGRGHDYQRAGFTVLRSS